MRPNFIKSASEPRLDENHPLNGVLIPRKITSMRLLTHSRLSRRKTGGAEPRGTRHLSASASNQEGGIFLLTLADRGHKKA
jgi:hypothetical protein